MSSCLFVLTLKPVNVLLELLEALCIILEKENILFLGCLPDPIKAGQLRQFFVMSFQLLPIICSLAQLLANSHVIVNTSPTTLY